MLNKEELKNYLLAESNKYKNHPRSTKMYQNLPRVLVASYEDGYYSLLSEVSNLPASEC